MDIDYYYGVVPTPLVSHTYLLEGTQEGSHNGVRVGTSTGGDER